MSDNENLELANAYFKQANNYYLNDNYLAALNNYLQGCDYSENIPAQVKFHMGDCYYYLEDNIKCLQTLSLISVDELGLFEENELVLIFYRLSESFHALGYHEAALNVMNFCLRIKADISIDFQVKILNLKSSVLYVLNLSDELEKCSNELINLINNAHESSPYLETHITLAFMNKASSFRFRGNMDEFRRYLNVAKTHAQKSDDPMGLSNLIFELEN